MSNTDLSPSPDPALPQHRPNSLLLVSNKDTDSMRPSALITPSGCALELLEPEIQRQILLETDTPNELHTLIKASARLYKVFLLNKRYILSSIARRQFHPEVLPDALEWANIAQLELPCPRETAIDFCNIDPSKVREWHNTVSTVPESVAMCKLASNLEFFIKDYARNTLPIIEGLVKPQELGVNYDFKIVPEYSPEHPVSISELSKAEIGRLQRAFCRFEIYRALFAKCAMELDHNSRECGWEPCVTPAEQAKLYLEKFPDYQVVEIICVRDYLVRRLHGVCAQVENEAVSTLSPEIFIFDGARGYDVEAQQWELEFYLFTRAGKHDQIGHFDYLMSLGLPYIRQILNSAGKEKTALFLNYNEHAVIEHNSQNYFISQALSLIGPNPAAKDLPWLEESDPPIVYHANPDAELNIPGAWQWAYSHDPLREFYDDFDHSCIKGLSDWGYVFWDHERLHKSGILQQHPGDVERVQFHEYDNQRVPSVQERLLDPLGIWYLGKKIR